ncbi:unnamed protein product [Cuscuta campestris]|uniref:C2 domain-containing protein n=1 Tax=Cuscuta campestris TaxID=132261 RepID=A0A484KNL0_9ASTE|nr:unnamed protein product [Cuscuta campestris]
MLRPQPAYNLMEINLISAHDLPPVSKTLRSYVVVWLDSGRKLTTRIDHDGRTNPTWNYRLVFRLDDRILGSGAVNFEIYNVAWLRDTPIGTATLALNSFFPPLSANNSAVRHAALPIRRPTGHLRGTLNVTIRLQEGGCDGRAEPSKADNFEDVDDAESKSVFNGVSERSKICGETEEINKTPENPLDCDHGNLKRTKSARIVSDKEDDEIEKNCRPSFSASYVSGMHPLPSEVAADLMKGYFSGGEEEEYGSSIFENWPLPGETKTPNKDCYPEGAKRDVALIPMAVKGHSRSGSWGDKTGLSSNHHRRHHHRRGRSGGGGLLSCFGNAYGVEFRLICGSDPTTNEKKIKKTKDESFLRKSLKMRHAAVRDKENRPTIVARERREWLRLDRSKDEKERIKYKEKIERLSCTVQIILD